MNATPTARRTLAVLLFLAIAATAWLSLHQALLLAGRSSRQDVVFNPGYQHSQRLQVATARAAMDVLGVLGVNGTAPAAASYRADYRRQRTQIQADSEGLQRWAAHDPRHQGLLLEIRASLAGLLIALDEASSQAPAQASGRASAQASSQAPAQTSASTPSPSTTNVPLLAALNRAHSALTNYSASLTEPRNLHTGPYLFAAPVRLWWLLILLLVEAALLAWLGFSTPELI